MVFFAYAKTSFSISSVFDGFWVWLDPWVAWPFLGPTNAGSEYVSDGDVLEILGPGAGCESVLFGTVSDCLVSGMDTDLARQVSVFQGPGAGFSGRTSSMCESGCDQDFRVASGSCKCSRDEEPSRERASVRSATSYGARQQYQQLRFSV